MPNQLEFLTQNDFNLLAGKSKKVEFAPGATLIFEGAPGREVLILRSGTASVMRNGSCLAKLGAGDICGEMAFLESGAASASVVADDRVTVESLSIEVLVDTFQAFPHLGSRFYKSVAVTLSRRLRETSRQLAKAQSAVTSA